MKYIDKLGLIAVKAGRVLVARSHGENAFYIPGGKREEGESDIQALLRESQEELGIELHADTAQLAGIFEAPAHGRDDTVVRVTAYVASYDGEPKPSSEVQELKWVNYDDRKCCSIVTQNILYHLYQRKFPSLCKYRHVFFDADKTLFTFDDKAGLSKVFSDHGYTFSDEQYVEYKALNTSLWQQYHQGKIGVNDIKQTRFAMFAEQLSKSSLDINKLFLDAMHITSRPLPGAKELLELLKDKGIKVGIITNGLTQIQQDRISRAGFNAYISALVISEAVGKTKPHPDIFLQACKQLGVKDVSTALMIGGSYDTDIKGANDFGIDSCLIAAPHSKEHSEIKPTLRITSLIDLYLKFFVEIC